jgi:hypothetical protein
VPVDDPQALLQRRRIWGVPPDAVAAWVAACQRAQADTRTQIAALEIRITHLAAERDATAATATVLKEEIARLEAEKAEWKDRPETIRAEAIQFVVDAYAEAQQAREQAAQEITAEKMAAQEAIEAERTAAKAEIAAMRSDLAAERRNHEEAIAALQQQRAETIASLDTIGRSLLMQLGRIDPTTEASDTPLHESVAAAPSNAPPDLRAEIVPDAAPNLPHMDAPPAPHEQPDLGAAIPLASDDVMTGDRRAVSSEDTMLARALDELEAILRGNRKAASEN